MKAFSKRPRFRFSLLGLLLFPVVFSAPFAWWCQESRWYHLEQAALQRLRSEYRHLEFEYCGSFNSEWGICGLAAHTLRCWFGFRNVGMLNLGPVARGELPSRDLIAFRRLHSLSLHGISRDTDLSCLSQHRHLQRLGISGMYPNDISPFEEIPSLDTIMLYVDFPEGLAASADYYANFSGAGNLRLIVSRYPYHEELNGRLTTLRPDCHIINRRPETSPPSHKIKWTSGCKVKP